MFTLTIEDKHGVIADEFCFNHGTYLIGRVEGNDIILPSSKVSRQHSRIFVREGHCFIEDLGSSNGVIVDGQRIQGERDLGTASQIRIGDFYLYLALNKDQDNNKQDVVSTHIVSQDENSYKLVRVGDGFAGEFFPLSEAQNTVGRTEDNAIFLNDPSISRQHARVDYDGLVYQLYDLGSSNGTCINEKRITGPTILRDGDRLSFGNLHFVFMPSSKHLSPEEFSPPPTVGGSGGGGMSAGMLVAIAAVMMFLFMGLVLVGGAGYWFYTKNQEPPETVVPKEPSQAELVDRALNEGQALMQSGHWDDSIKKFDEVLALDANNEDAKRFKSQAQKEGTANVSLDEGLSLKGKGEYDAASKKFKSIPEGTNAYKQARKELKEVEGLFAGNLKREGISALKDKDYLVAHQKLTEAAGLKCDKDLVDRIDEAEKAMTKGRKNRAEYKGKYKPFRAPASCR